MRRRLPVWVLYRRVGVRSWRARWFARPFLTLTEFSFEWGPTPAQMRFVNERGRR